MPAGTIALTNNSATVTGTGTNFTTELKVNDFLVSTVGGMAYTLGVKSIESNTSLTLMEKYTGPSATGQSWTPIPYGTMAAITAQLAAQVTYAIRGFNLDKANWQQILTGSGTVTVTLPDGTSWQGPAWGGITTALNSKANLVNDVVEVAHGGTGQKSLSGVMTWLGLGDAAFKNTGTTSGTLAAGNDSRLNTINNKSGGSLAAGSGLDIISNTFSNPATGTFLNGVDFRSFINGRGAYGDSRGAFFGMRAIEQVGSSVFGVLQYNGWSVDRFWRFYSNGNAEATAGTWTGTSDKRLKTNIELVDEPLEKMRKIRGYTWDRLDDAPPGQGFIAQELEEIFPGAVFEGGDRQLKDGTIVKNAKTVDIAGPSAALHHEAILALMDKLDEKDAVIAELQKRMKAIDGLDA